MRKCVDNIECSRCDYLGEYDDLMDDNKEYMSTMLQWYRESVEWVEDFNAQFSKLRV